MARQSNMLHVINFKLFIHERVWPVKRTQQIRTTKVQKKKINKNHKKYQSLTQLAAEFSLWYIVFI